MIAPNKQNLLILNKQKKMILNGHKLLKEKRTGLIKKFLEISKEGKDLEKKIENKKESIIDYYLQAVVFIDLEKLIKLLDFIPCMKLEIKKNRISGVKINEINIQLSNPKRESFKSSLKSSLGSFANIFLELIKLEEIKMMCKNFAYEIQKTNRQITNLENKIEQISNQIKWIKMTIMEKSNLEKATLIKIFK